MARNVLTQDAIMCIALLVCFKFMSVSPMFRSTFNSAIQNLPNGIIYCLLLVAVIYKNYF